MKKAEIIIKKISWERVFLHITIEPISNKFSIEDHKLGLYNKGLEKFIQVFPLKQTEKEYEIELNMTCVKDRTFLPNGEWKLGYFEEEEFINATLIAKEVAYQYDDLSKIFRYGKGNQYAYTVDFNLTTDEENGLMFFGLRSYFMKKIKVGKLAITWKKE